MKFNDAYIIVDERNFLMVLRELGDLPEDIDANDLSYSERQELRPVKGVMPEWQLNLSEEGKKALEELKKTVITKDYGVPLNKVGRYYLSQERLEKLAEIIERFGQ